MILPRFDWCILLPLSLLVLEHQWQPVLFRFSSPVSGWSRPLDPCIWTASLSFPLWCFARIYSSPVAWCPIWWDQLIPHISCRSYIEGLFHCCVSVWMLLRSFDLVQQLWSLSFSVQNSSAIIVFCANRHPLLLWCFPSISFFITPFLHLMLARLFYQLFHTISSSICGVVWT